MTSNFITFNVFEYLDDMDDDSESVDEKHEVKKASEKRHAKEKATPRDPPANKGQRQENRGRAPQRGRAKDQRKKGAEETWPRGRGKAGAKRSERGRGTDKRTEVVYLKVEKEDKKEKVKEKIEENVIMKEPEITITEQKQEEENKQIHNSPKKASQTENKSSDDEFYASDSSDYDSDSDGDKILPQTQPKKEDKLEVYRKLRYRANKFKRKKRRIFIGIEITQDTIISQNMTIAIMKDDQRSLIAPIMDIITRKSRIYIMNHRKGSTYIESRASYVKRPNYQDYTKKKPYNSYNSRHNQNQRGGVNDIYRKKYGDSHEQYEHSENYKRKY